MTNEERDIITQFIARVSGDQAQGRSSFGGSVPVTTQPLPPVDPEADRLIADLFNRYPSARYRLAQLAFVQEHALTEAQNRMQRMESELQQARQAQQQQQSGSGGGFFSGLFGGGRSSAPPAQGGPGPAWNQGPQPNYQQGYQPPPQQPPPGYQPGMFQRQGSGFLGSALTTAAGVAGGLVAGNALMSLFSGSHGGGFGSGFGGGNTTIIEENNPWGGAAQQGGVDQGTRTDPGSAPGADPGYVDSGTWDTSGGDQSWTDNTSDPGWDTSGSQSDDDTF